MNYNPQTQFSPTATVNTGYTYNSNPSPSGTGGFLGGLFGRKPEPVGIPQPYQDLAKVYPNLPETSNVTQGDILDRLHGTLAPDTVNLLKDNSAERAVLNGMPGSGLSNNSFLASVGKASQAQQSGGLGDYLSTIPTVASTQITNPNFEAELAQLNAINSAAPNPGTQGLFKGASSLFGNILGGGLGDYFGGSPSMGTLRNSLDGGNAFGMGDGFESSDLESGD